LADTSQGQCQLIAIGHVQGLVEPADYRGCESIRGSLPQCLITNSKPEARPGGRSQKDEGESITVHLNFRT
jgi:hypothetical protein